MEIDLASSDTGFVFSRLLDLWEGQAGVSVGELVPGDVALLDGVPGVVAKVRVCSDGVFVVWWDKFVGEYARLYKPDELFLRVGHMPVESALF